MNSRFRSLTLAAFVLGTLAFASGCETSNCTTEEGQDAVCAESLERYTESAINETITVPYEPGTSLVVDNIKGHIHVCAENEQPNNADACGGADAIAGEISVLFVPFTFRGHSKDAEARAEMEGLMKTVQDDGAGTITVRTDPAEGSSDEVGATLYVRLPPEFDGNLKVVNQGFGNVEEADIIVDTVSMSPYVYVQSDHGLGDCDVDGAPTVVNTEAYCRGQIEITNVSDNVTADSTGPFTDGDDFAVRVDWAGISDAATGGTIRSDEGHIELDVPSTGNFSIAATSNVDGAVNEEGTQPSTCSTEGAGTSKTLTCGTGGATFTVTAATEESFDGGNVNIVYKE
jgi:hypothetical protein